MKKGKLWLTGTALLALGTAACSDPPEAEEVADATAGRSAQMVREVGTSLRMMSEMSSMQGMGNAASVLQGSFAGVPFMGGGGTQPSPTPSPMPGAPDPATTDAQAALLEKYLRERIFTEQNVESQEGDSVTFRLTGEDVCTTGSAPVEPMCAAEVDRLQVRIRATRAGKDGMDLELLIGPNQARPLTLSFAPKTAAVVVDLAGAKEALVVFSPGAAQGLPRTMNGRVEARLTENGPQDITFSTSILDAIRVEMVDMTGAVRSFSTAATSPLTSMRMEGQAQRASFELNLGATEFRGPYGGTSALAGKPMVVSLSGLSYAFSAQEGQQDFTLAHLGIGQVQSYVSLDGTKLVTADLNALSGRHFDLQLSQGADGLPLMRVVPEFDLALRFFLQPLRADPMASVPPYYEDQSYRVRLSGGGGPSVRPVPADTATGFPGGLKVVSGELALEATGASVTVPTGSCLVGKAQPDEGAHPLLGYFESRACP
jgi:hypothetical protein